MRSCLAEGSVLACALLFPFLAGAQPPPSAEVKVLAVGEKVISIIDDTSYSVLATVPHPAGDVHGWWPAEDGSRATFLFQTPQRKGFNYRDPARIQVFDLTEQRAIADLPLDIGLDLAVASPDGKIVVMVFEGRKGAGSLLAVDAVGGVIAGRYAVTDPPSYLLFGASSNRLLAVVAGETDEQPEDRIAGRIDLFDLPALAARGSIALPGPVAAVFWNADRTLLFALDQGVDSKRRERVLPRRMYVVDPAAGALVADVELGPPSAAWDGETIGVLPAPDHSRYCILERQGIAVLDGKATKLLGTIPLPRDPGGMLFLNPPNRAYVYHQDSSVVSVVDLEKQLALVDITTGRKGVRAGKWAAAIAVALLAPGMSGDVLRSVMADTETWGVVAPDGKTVFLANSQSWDVTVVDTATNQVLETFGGSPPRLLADGRTVAAPEAFGLSLYDIVEHKLLAPLPLAEGGSVCPDGRHVWTGQSPFGGGVYRIDVEQRMVEKPLKGAKGVALFFVVPHP